MKLDVAVDNADVEIDVDIEVEFFVLEKMKIRKLQAGLAGIAFGFCTLLAGSAIALDGIDLSQPVEAVAAGECPRLIQIKYPFLKCASGEIAQSDADDTWENSRRIPKGSHFIEGNGYWGADLNRD